MSNLVFRRRAMMITDDDEVYILGATSGERGNYFDDFTFTMAVNQNPIPIMGGDTLIFTRNILHIKVYNEQKKYLDYYGTYGSQVDTAGRNVRQVKIHSSARWVGVCLNMTTFFDSYVYNVTQEKFLFKGANIPEDYVPEIAS